MPVKCSVCGELFKAINYESLCPKCEQKLSGPVQIIQVPDFQSHHVVANEIANLLDQKRADYGVENIKKFGSNGILVRVSDKVERLINLSRKEGAVLFESVEDTWRDIAGYAVLALIELREGR